MAIVEDFYSWLGAEPGFHAPLESPLFRLPKGSRALCCGPFSLLSSLILAEEGHEVSALCADGPFLEDFRLRLDPGGAVGTVHAIPECLDFLYAPLFLNFLSKREAASFLLDASEALKPGGLMVLSFMDSLRPEPGEGRPRPLWFSPETEVPIKLYSLDDALNTFSALSLKAKAVDELDCEGISHTVSIELTKLP